MNNPIIQRELIGLLRTKRAFLLMVTLSLILAALVILRWPVDAQSTHNQAQDVLRLFGYGLLVGLIFLAPIFPATTVVREKLTGTLILLLNSPLSPLDILVGKLVGVLGYIILLLIVSFPAAAACYAMGGISLVSQLGVVYLILLLLAVQYATLGLWISTHASTTDSALRMTYGAIILMAIIPLGPQLFLQGQLSDPTLALIVDWSRCFSPIPAMMSALGHEAIGAQGLQGAGFVGLRYAILALITIAFFVFATLKRLDQRIFDKPRDAGKATDDRTAGEQAYRRVMYLWFFDPQRRTKPIGPLTNPVMIKEFRCQKFGRSYWMMRLIAGTFVVSLGLMLATTTSTISWGVETIYGIMVIMQIALLVILTPSLASGLISVERESRGWQLLQMTPLSARQIVFGKLLSVARTLGLVLLATIPAYAIMLGVDFDKCPLVINVLITLLFTSLFAMLTSAAMSSIFSRTAAATATSYAIVLLLVGGTMLVWLGRDASFTQSTVLSVLQVNPLAAALTATKAHGFEAYATVPMTLSRPDLSKYVPPMVQANWFLMATGSLLMLCVLTFRTWRLTRPQ